MKSTKVTRSNIIINNSKKIFDYIPLKFLNINKFNIRKSIRLRTFVFHKKSIIFIVRLSLKTNYERFL
jgi:hypothetical protein